MGATKEANFSPKGYQQITDLAASTSLTVPAGATRALIRAEGADVRWRDDGTDPTAAVGMVLQRDMDMWFTGDLGEVEFIQVSAGAKLNVSYYC